MRRCLVLVLIAVTASLLASACGGEEPEPQTADDVVTIEPSPEPTGEPVAEPEPAPAPPPITVTAGENGPLPEGATPTVRILSPTKNQVIRNGPVKVRLQVRNWPTQAGGPHIHLIVDDQPYRRIDDPSQPIEIADLAEGEHWLRTFPSRQTHESVKTPGAFAWVRFFVGSRPADAQNPPRPMPMLTYSRPKGAYEGNAMSHVLLDFYLTDTTLAPDAARVHYWIDGANEGDATAWVPHHIDNLAEGSHRVTLELRDAQNQPIPGRFNRAEQEITCSRTPAAPAPAPAAEHSGH